MIKTIKARMHKDEEEGFTLIELLVVVLILGILMAIAIPTFLSLTSGAKQNAAESDLTTAAQDEATSFTQYGTYANSTSGANAVANNVLDMKAIDTGLNWVATTPGTAGTKSIAVNNVTATGASAEVDLSTVGQDKNTYFIIDKAGTLSYYYDTSGTAPVTADTLQSSWKSLPATPPTS